MDLNCLIARIIARTKENITNIVINEVPLQSVTTDVNEQSILVHFLASPSVSLSIFIPILFYNMNAILRSFNWNACIFRPHMVPVPVLFVLNSRFHEK